MKKILIGAVIGGLITAFLFYKFLPRPGPGEPIVIYKDKIISGQMSGKVKIVSKSPQEDGDNIQTINDKETIKIDLPDPVSVTNNRLDFNVSIPVSGEIKTGHVDLQFTGVTTVERKGDNLKVNTVFDQGVKETIYQEPKIWHVGLYAGAIEDGFGIGGFVQRNFKLATIKKVDLIGFGRVEVDRDPKLLVGVEGNF